MSASVVGVARPVLVAYTAAPRSRSMPSAAFLACASSSFAWPLAAASLAATVAVAAVAFTLSSSPIGRLPFLAPDIMGPLG